MKYILTDIDDTILQFSDAFQDWLENKGYHNKGRIRDGYKLENALGLSSEESDNLIIQFSEDTEHMPYLKAEPDAAVVLPILQKMGYKFVAISACVNSEVTINARHTNLAEAFPDIIWYDIHCVGLHQTKNNHLKMYDSTWWVEDNPKHALRGAEIGHQSFLLDRAYNSHLDIKDNPYRVKNWHDIFDHIVRSDSK